MLATIPRGLPEAGVFWKDTLVKGQPARIECVDLLGQTYTVTRGMLNVVALEDEWYDDVRDPAAVIRAVANHPQLRADLFTFWQRLPDLQPRYPHHLEWEHIAALRVSTYEHWWSQQIKSRVRSLIRKAEKDGVVVHETSYDDAFVRGLTAIFNEAPIRQGRPFWHFGKDVETVRRQFSRCLDREHMIAAYHAGEMVGVLMFGNAGAFGLTGQILASLKHRDKAVANALVAKAVELCERLGLEYLVYFFWTNDSLGEFKRRCGFERLAVPRYYVPLTSTGRLALATGLHRGWRSMLPTTLKNRLKQVRTTWYEWHHGRRRGSRA